MSAAPPPPVPVWHRFVAGSASGVALVLVGHPLDTLRLRVQLGEGSPVVVMRRLAAGGLRAWYAGMGPPLLLTGSINTVLWGLTMSATAAMEDAGLGGVGGGSATARACAAAIPCGVAISLLVTPMEGVKSRMQASAARAGGSAGGAWAVAARAIAADGIARGLYRGWSACALARASNYAYFGGNAAASELLAHYAPPRSAAARTRNTLVSGAAAGVCYWLCALPFDTLKGRMMAAPDGMRPRPTLRSTARALVAEAGVRGLYRGLSPALARAVPANAAAFLAFDATMQALARA